jgi:hypothetical protein
MSYAATGSQEGSGHGGARALDRLLHLSSLDDKWTVEYIWLGAVFSRRPARRGALLFLSAALSRWSAARASSAPS